MRSAKSQHFYSIISHGYKRVFINEERFEEDRQKDLIFLKNTLTPDVLARFYIFLQHYLLTVKPNRNSFCDLIISKRRKRLFHVNLIAV